MKASCAALLLAGLITSGFAQSPKKAHKPELQPAVTTPALRGTLLRTFNAKISEYLTVQKRAKSTASPLKTTTNVHEIAPHQKQLADAIRTARSTVGQGDIFNPAVADLFRASIATSFRAAGAKIRSSLRHAEPAKFLVEVNATYPDNVPLQSTPPSILLNLPRLPKGLEYRIVGSNLVLRDAEANLIVDYIPNALPQI